MKKLALIAVVASSVAVAAPFNGFSVGAKLGGNFSKAEATAQNGRKASENYNALLVGILASYTRSFENMFVGGDVAVELNLYKKKEGSEKSQNSKTLSLAPRVGYKVDETMGIYGKMAVGFNSYNLPNDSDFSKSTTSFMPAIGLEKAISNEFSIRGELGYRFEKLKVKNEAKHLIKSAKMNGVVVTVGASYNF